MIGLAPGVRIWLVSGICDMRKGMDSLSAHVQTALSEDPFGGQLFIFPGTSSGQTEDSVAPGTGTVPVLPQIGRRPFCMATAEQRDRAVECCATVAPLGRDRLAPSSPKWPC
jgi:hypothetical protein